MRTCTIEGCDNKLKAKGYCVKHHQRYRRHGDANYQKVIALGTPLSLSPFLKANRICDVDGCNNIHAARGLCRMHYAKRKNTD